MVARPPDSLRAHTPKRKPAPGAPQDGHAAKAQAWSMHQRTVQRCEAIVAAAQEEAKSLVAEARETAARIVAETESRSSMRRERETSFAELWESEEQSRPDPWLVPFAASSPG